MLLKEKRMRWQQMLQALVFQFKAVNTQQTTTIIDAIHVGGLLHAITSKITRIVRVGKRTRDWKALLKVRLNDTGPIAGEGSHLTTSNPPVQEVMEDADNQGAGEKGRPVRQNMYRGYRPRFRRAPPRQRQPREDGNEENKENQGDETQGQQPLLLCIAATSITDADTQRTLNHKMAKRQKQLIHQLRIRPLPRLSRVGLSKCRFTISTIIRFDRPTRRNGYEIPAIRNEQPLEPKPLSACFLPLDQIH